MTAPLGLVRLLADGGIHSGAALAGALGLTRAAVWKQVQALEGLGLEVVRRRGRGYALARPLDLLDPGRIASALRAQASALGRVDVREVVDSTSAALAGAPHGTVCIAEFQSAGRGRRGRVWVSPYGVNLSLSLVWQFECGPARLSGLSIALGMALAQTLRTLGAPVQVKWPNDLLCEGAKLGGILIEVSGDAEGPCRVVAGVGINVNMRAVTPPPDQPWTSLARVLGRDLDRSALAVQVLGGMESVMTHFPAPGLAAYQAQWEALDAYAGRQLRAEFAGEIVAGRSLGLDRSGGLRIHTPSGERTLQGGEISLREHGPAA